MSGSPRRAAKSDANQPRLLLFARQLGLLVVVIQWPVDWLIWDGMKWAPVEIKNLEGRNRYTDDQKTFRTQAEARGAPVLTWRCEQDILDHCNGRYR